jgi:Phage major capsid protein E
MMINDFTLTELTSAINQFPIQWGRVSQSGLFADRGVRTREITLEEQSGTLALLPTHEWGGEGTVASKLGRNTYAFGIKQTVHDDLISAADIQGIRAFGSEALADMSTETARRLQRMRARHDITLEYKRMGALKGNVLNADGASLANLFTTFGIAQVTVDFVLGTAGTDIRAKCEAVYNQIQDNLKGDVMNGVRVLVSQEFFAKLVVHPNVVDYIKNTPSAKEFMQTRLNQIEVYGLVFEQYRASVNGTRLITAQEGHAYPEGTTDTFATYYAPADFNEAANTIGLPIYVKTWPKEGDRGLVLHTQCNSLPLCHQPAVLVKVTTSN